MWLPARVVALAGGPTALQLAPDATVLGFTLVVCLLSCVMFGLAPALHGTRRDAFGALKEGSKVPGTRFTLRTLLLSIQVAAVVILLADAGVMVRSAQRAADRVLAGADPDIAVVSIDTPVKGYDAARVRTLAMELEQALETPERDGRLALTSTAPLTSGNIKGSFQLPGQGDDLFNVVFEVSPSYFRVMGGAILEGRGFRPDDRDRPVIVVNQTMAKQYWPGRSAVGQRVVCAEGDSGWNRTGELEIIGVARDTFLTSMDQTEPTIFQLPTYRSLPRVLATNRTAADAAIVAARRIDPGLRIRVDSLMAAFAPRFRGTRVGAAIAGSLGLLALGFAGVGMFGVFAYWVRQRTQEIGVRMALGAQSSDVVGLVLGTTARAVLIGIAAGIAASVASARLLTAFLFGLSGVDPLTYAAVAAILVGASLLAAVLPAWRATRIDPLVALRYE